MRSLAALALGVWSMCVCAAPADADEKEWILSFQPGFAVARIEEQSAWGGGAGLDLSYGVTDALAVRLTGAVTAHDLGETKTHPAGTLLGYQAGAGLTYTIDILRLVPYFDLAVGLLGWTRPAPGGGREVSNQLGVQVGIGVDYLINRRFAVGFVVRYHAPLTALSTLPAYLYAGPRIAIHFGG